MSEMTKEQTELLSLIQKLPVADGKIPLNDQKQPDGTVILGAHGEANKTEAAIAGILKAHVIVARMNEITQAGEGYDMNVSLRAIANIASSMDAAEERHTTDMKKKIEALAVPDEVKEIVTKAVAYVHGNAEAADIVARIKNLQLPASDTSTFVTPEIIEAARAKHYEITPGGNLFNQSSVRLGSVTIDRSLQNLQKVADSVSDDEAQRTAALVRFTEKLKGTPILQGNEVRIFDIGHGSGKVAAAAVETLQQTGADVHYTGIEPMAEIARPGAKKALQATGLLEDKITFLSGTFGMAETDAQLAAHAGKQNLVVASHLYNTKGMEAFTRQADRLLNKDGVIYLLHESSEDSWLADFRSRHSDKLRGGASDRVTEIKNYLGNTQRDYATFRVATTDRIDPLTKKEMAVFKSMETGVFTRDYSSHFPEGPERDSFRQKQQLVEYFLRSPLESFKQEDRAVLLDDFQQRLQQGNGRLVRYSEAQAMLSPQHSRNLEVSKALHTAAAETNRYFALQEQGELHTPLPLAESKPVMFSHATRAGSAAGGVMGVAGIVGRVENTLAKAAKVGGEQLRTERTALAGDVASVLTGAADILPKTGPIAPAAVAVMRVAPIVAAGAAYLEVQAANTAQDGRRGSGAIGGFVAGIGTGMASGAAAGSVLGPWGAAIGGIVGGFGAGYVGSEIGRTSQWGDQRQRDLDHKSQASLDRSVEVIGELNHKCQRGEAWNDADKAAVKAIGGLMVEHVTRLQVLDIPATDIDGKLRQNYQLQQAQHVIDYLNGKTERLPMTSQQRDAHLIPSLDALLPALNDAKIGWKPHLDADKSGKVDRAEILQTLQKYGVELHTLDKDGRNGVAIDELTQVLKALKVDQLGKVTPTRGAAHVERLPTITDETHANFRDGMTESSGAGQKRFLEAMASWIPEMEKAGFGKTIGHDGKITVEELSEALKRTGIRASDVDRDGNGNINEREAIAALRAFGLNLSEQTAVAAAANTPANTDNVNPRSRR